MIASTARRSIFVAVSPTLPNAALERPGHEDVIGAPMIEASGERE